MYLYDDRGETNDERKPPIREPAVAKGVRGDQYAWVCAVCSLLPHSALLSSMCNMAACGGSTRTKKKKEEKRRNNTRQPQANIHHLERGYCCAPSPLSPYSPVSQVARSCRLPDGVGVRTKNARAQGRRGRSRALLCPLLLPLSLSLKKKNKAPVVLYRQPLSFLTHAAALMDALTGGGVSQTTQHRSREFCVRGPLRFIVDALFNIAWSFPSG